MADSTKFSQSEWMFMDLTILTNFCHFLYFLHIWTYLTSSLFNIFVLGKKNRQRTRMKETRDIVATDPGQRLFLLYTWRKTGITLHKNFKICIAILRAFFFFFFTRSWRLVGNAICPKGGVKMNTRLKSWKQEIWGEIFMMRKLWHCFFPLEITKCHWPFYFLRFDS